MPELFVKSDLFQARGGGFDWVLKVPAWLKRAKGHADTVQQCYMEINAQLALWAEERGGPVVGETLIQRSHFDSDRQMDVHRRVVEQ